MNGFDTILGIIAALVNEITEPEEKEAIRYIKSWLEEERLEEKWHATLHFYGLGLLKGVDDPDAYGAELTTFFTHLTAQILKEGELFDPRRWNEERIRNEFKEFIT